MPELDGFQVTEGNQAPDFRLAASTGGKISLSDYRGKSNVVLFFVREFV